MLRLLLLLPAMLLSLCLGAQVLKGRVLDSDTRRPLPGAVLTLTSVQPPLGALSDSAGYFRISGLPVGRHTLACRFPGYQPYVQDNLIVASTRATEVEILLQEETAELYAEEVVISAREYPTRAINDLAVVSARSFSAEETQLVPAGVNDPGRMALSFPGVQQGGDDSENDIIIRGNSSFGMLWRLEGIDIPNPNHFARPGTSGGGITVFSAQLLDNSDFYTGGMPAEFGNAISGAMDVRFRKGNMDSRDYRFRLSLLGLDLSAEGPFQQGRSSYLVNYRYSTLGILNRLGFNLVGERVNNDFQDLSFNLTWNSRDGRTMLTWFGMGGLSLEQYLPVSDPAAREPGRGDHWEDRRQGSNMAASGITLTRLLDERSYLRAVLAVMHSDIFREYDTLDLADIRYRYNTEEYRDQRISASLVYSRKLSARSRFKSGVFFHQIFYEFFRASRVRRVSSNITETPPLDPSVDGLGNTQQAQAYALISQDLAPGLTLNAGLHFLHLFLNGSSSLEPRISMKYQFARRQSLSFAYGLHGQTLPLGAYFSRITDSNGQEQIPNLDLPMIKSHHGVLAYSLILGKGFHIQAESYAQRLLNVPVDPASGSTWWMLNNQAGLAERALLSEGRGLNYGLDLVLEKFFSRGYFLMLNYSRFASTYEMPDGRRFNTRFGTRFSSSYTAGKEFTFRSGGVLLIGARALYNGGFRYTPADEARSQAEGRFVADETRAWEGQVTPYQRIDARIAYRFNKKRVSGMVNLDIQNLSNRQNANSIGYNPVTGETFLRNHPSELIPVLGFQLDF